MNVLTEQFPTAVMIDGEAVPIVTDFRAALRTVLAFEDPELTGYEKQMILLGNLYPTPPANLQAAIEQGVKFLNGGEAAKDEGQKPRVFSFAKDDEFIFSAFRQTHGIDLETAQMHWWKFLALFMDLGSETSFCNLISLRQRVQSGKATKEERAAAAQMGDLFDVPQADSHNADEQAQADEFLRLVKAQKR